MSQGQFNKQKTYSLILAGLALLGMILPWVSISTGIFGKYTVNGFRDVGYISLLGIIAVIAAVFMNGQNNGYDNNGRLLTLGGFGGIIAGGGIWLIKLITNGGISNIGLGLILSLAAGILGLLIYLGKVKPPASIDEKVNKL